MERYKDVELNPDLILMDVGLPLLNGIEAARRIRELVPESKIIFLSQETSADVVEECCGGQIPTREPAVSRFTFISRAIQGWVIRQTRALLLNLIGIPATQATLTRLQELSTVKIHNPSRSTISGTPRRQAHQYS